MEELKKELEILTNSNRLKILKYLKRKGEKSVGDIAGGTNLSFNTASKQLLYLAEKGVLRRRYDTPFVLYSVKSDKSELLVFVISKFL